MHILEPIVLGDRQAVNRLMFGPHVTNLGTDFREFSARHVAYYERRARGGCGIVVTEGASVHESDWPYERAPLAAHCESGWSDIVAACHQHGALVIASLDHAGGQGSSAYSQSPLWAPSRVPEVNTREVPKWMEPHDIAAVIAGFADAASVATRAGCDGVEINAGQHSLVRQFLSGLTNHRDDQWGTDRLLFARNVLTAVRAVVDAAAPGAILGLRLSCDELAPWAGITAEMAPDIARQLAAIGLDYLVVVRGSIFSVEQTRPDFHVATDFNVELCRSLNAAFKETSASPSLSSTAIFLQGSVVDIERANWAVSPESGPVCDGVEMTRAQIADPDLAIKAANAEFDRIRPCIRCNQVCQVRDARNPIVSCVGEPSSGHEHDDPDWYRRADTARRVLIVGGGPAGLEAARVATLRGHHVTLYETASALGGIAGLAGPGKPLTDWLIAEVTRLGVRIECDVPVDRPVPADEFDVVIQATGSRRGHPEFFVNTGSTAEDQELIDTAFIDVADLYRGTRSLPVDATVVILDPIGGPIGVAVAESLGDRAILITPDNIAGNELSRSGDLAPANVRLAQRGVQIQRRSVVRGIGVDNESLVVMVQDRFSGDEQEIRAAAVVDAGFRLPNDEPIDAAGRTVIPIGDCVTPRSLLEAILEARRAALQI